MELNVLDLVCRSTSGFYPRGAQCRGMRDERVAAAAQWATGGANRCCEEAVVFVNFELWQALPMVKTLQAPNKRRRGKGAGACRWERMRGQRRSLECRKGRGSAVGVGRQNSAGAGGVLGVCGTGRCPAFGGGRGREGERMGNGRTLSEGVAGKKTDGLPRRKTQKTWRAGVWKMNCGATGALGHGRARRGGKETSEMKLT